jgi:hypothetical protein
MIFGFGLLAGGYAVFYWGLHHFCNVDCIKGQTNPNGCCDNRVSLFDALGVPSKWGMSKAPPVQLNPLQTGNSSTQNQPGSPGANPPNAPTQPQQPSNTTTPSNLNNNPMPGVTPSQIPGVPHQAQIVPGSRQPGGGSAGGVIPLGSPASPTPATILPSSYSPTIGNWLRNLFTNPTSPFGIAKKDIQGLWHEITGIF